MANMPVAMSMHPDTARDPGDEQPGNAMDIDQQTNESVRLCTSITQFYKHLRDSSS